MSKPFARKLPEGHIMTLDIPRAAFSPGDDLPSVVDRIARERPGDVALLFGERRITWAELDSAVSRVAHALLATPRTRGERVAILAGTSPEYMEAFFGALRAGLCAVPLPTLASPETLGLLLDDSGATVLFASEAYREVARGLLAGRAVQGVAFDFEDEAFVRYQDLPRPAAPGLLPVIAGEDAFDVIYSSGTTGVPKGIVHSHGARKASYAGSRAAYFSQESVNVIATPFYSNTTCVTWFLTTATGGTNVLLPKFSADAFLEVVERRRATHAMLVPVQYERLLASERIRTADLSSLRYLFSTSAPLRAETKSRILGETGAELVEIYGLTEGGPVTVLEARRHPDKLASVGLPAPGTELRVVDEAGHDVPAGQAGEVLGRSANMMDGYQNRPEETAALLFRHPSDGKLYFRTGDIGRLDADGFLYLLDRKKDVIISGGFNVYATDLEAVLLAHVAVAEAAVIGVPSERWGETPLGLVVLRPGHSVTAGELLAHANGRVGKVQRLSSVEVRSELPKNAIGKILKRDLRAPYWSAEA